MVNRRVLSGSCHICDLRAIVLAVLVALASGAWGAEPSGAVISTARKELDVVRALVPAFRVLPLPAAAGELTLTTADSLTVEHLRGIEIDPHPPVPAKRTVRYDPRMADDCPPGSRPYVAGGIRPFRFRFFHCEFNYGGWHNYDMQDYAASHGFDILSTYVRTPEEVKHWPAGTGILHWGGFVNWHKWLPAHGKGRGRYDALATMDVTKRLLEEGVFRRDPKVTRAAQLASHLMIDMEHPVLSPKQLRAQAWYPSGAAPAERRAFEKRYYDGYATTYIAPVRAARRSGWTNISLYGWYPYGRTWGGLETVRADPGTDQAWNAFGRQVLDAVDLVNNSVYCFYWSPQNVAYTLANVDANLRMVRSASRPKPVRPYYWTLLHGGGGGWRWWRDQPIANEEKRAMIAMGFFTGFDGFDTWNWSGTGSHHTVALGATVKETVERDGKRRQVTEWRGHDVMVGRAFRATDASGREEFFGRYTVLHVLSRDAAARSIRFQRIRPGAKNHGVTDDQPVFAMGEATLRGFLRPKSEPVAAMIEGLALVKPFEYLLRHGAVEIDVPASEQFAKTLPIVRRVRLGRWHVLISYDPKVIYGGRPREIVLADFGGVKGRTLRLPADAETRVFVVKAP